MEPGIDDLVELLGFLEDDAEDGVFLPTSSDARRAHSDHRPRGHLGPTTRSRAGRGCMPQTFRKLFRRQAERLARALQAGEPYRAFRYPC